MLKILYFSTITLILNGLGGCLFRSIPIYKSDSTVYNHPVVIDQNQPSGYKTYRSKSDHISLRYPDFFRIIHKAVADTSGWSYACIQKGRLIVQLSTLKSYQPKTNLAEATFTVGWSNLSKALKGCLKIPPNQITKSDTVTLNNATYIRSDYEDAGAGNFYHIIRYRTIKNNRCYSIEEMVHYMNIFNYPAERGIKKFDRKNVWNALNTILNSITVTN